VLQRRSAEHWTGRLYMRRVSIYGTRLALRLGLSANNVTGLMIVAGLVAVGFFAVPGLWWAVAGTLLIQLYLGLDCVDGEVARVSGTEGARGVYLDRLGHYLVEGGILAALGMRAGDGALEPIIVGLFGAIGVILQKVETDLVTVARLGHGLGSVDNGATEMKLPALARGRRIARMFPLHMATHAAEASLLILAAAIADEVRGDLIVTRILLVGLAVIAVGMVVLSLVAVLNSRRLDP
jgi:phosphatidylglycerophosphate synthase